MKKILILVLCLFTLSINSQVDLMSVTSPKYVNDYEKSMEVVKDENGKEVEVSFALTSHYTDNGNYVDIGDWVWKRNDGKEKFAFDSEAERAWTSILKDLAKDDLAVGDGRVGKRVTLSILVGDIRIVSVATSEYPEISASTNIL